ncbi:MAG: cold shock domain-containing protein [Flavobacteriales bacterium]|nr:cold shock domain-containing protein [Flavobacteriales bacterium]
MSRSPETSGKKDREKKRLQKRNEKEQKRQERKSESKKGMGFDSMIGYVDEYGRLTDTPPSEQGKRAVVNVEDIVLGATTRVKEKPEDRLRTGTVTFFNESKGYGFIRDTVSGQSIFVHVNAATYQMKENDKVTFEIVAGQKGPAASQVKKA